MTAADRRAAAWMTCQWGNLRVPSPNVAKEGEGSNLNLGHGALELEPWLETEGAEELPGTESA